MTSEERPPKISSSWSKGPKKIGHDWYKKTQNFMLVSKIQTYLSDKMHLKKVITKKPTFLDKVPI
jgi:hypothetical protein